MNIKSLSTWSLTLILSAMFLMAGSAKVSGAEQMVQNFQHMEVQFASWVFWHAVQPATTQAKACKK